MQILIFGQTKLDEALQIRGNQKHVSNIVHINEDAYVGLSASYGQNIINKIIRVPQGKPQMETFMPVLPWPVETYGLASFKGSLLVLGGKFTSADKPAGAGTYSNKVFTYSPQTKKIEVTIPPMRVACASPAIVTHEELIIVVHGEGADSAVEVLDTTSPNPEWKEAEALPYFSPTPSATIASGYLVVWIGAVYCMHLSCITAPKKSSKYLPSSWFALPSPPESTSLQLANYKGRLAAFALGKNRKANVYVFDHSSKQWINLQEMGSTCHYGSRIRASVTTQSVVVILEGSRTTEGRLTIQTGAIENN